MTEQCHNLGAKIWVVVADTPIALIGEMIIQDVITRRSVLLMMTKTDNKQVIAI
mgnify:CR=1 FL=1